MTLLTLFVSLAVLPQERDQTPMFRVAVEAVQVDVFVGRKGKALLGLGPHDFELYDNDVRQKIDLVGVDTLPLSVALVLDTSNSVAGEKLRHLRSAALGFLAGLDEDDRAGIVSFSDWIDRRSGLTADKEKLESTLDGVKAGGATSWHDALFVGLKTVEPEPNRQMVLLFTDGEDTYSWLREEQLHRLVRQSNTVIYAIAKRPPGEKFDMTANVFRRRRELRRTRREEADRTRLLRKLTSDAGGRLLETETPEELRDVFLTILTEMKTRYVLTYRPEGGIDEGWHELEVKVKTRGVDVRARRGYFYESVRE